MWRSLDVRRLAALDLHGVAGTSRRRRIVLSEFLLGTAVMIAFGIWLIAASNGPANRLFGYWMIGAGANYLPLSVHALQLRRPDRLARELVDVDVRAQLRRYSLLQLWIFLPLSLVVLDLLQRARERRGGRR